MTLSPSTIGASTTLRTSMGNTPLESLSTTLREWFGGTYVKNVHVKREDKNPLSHTHKDRRSAMIVEEALRKNIDTLVLITAGNAGFSLARAAEGSQLRVVCIVDEGTPQHIREKLTEAKAKVITSDLKQKIPAEAIVNRIAKNIATKTDERIWNVTNGCSHAYSAIVDELYHEKPDTIIAPVGSGELVMGLYEGIERNGLSTKIIGVGVRSRRSMADKLSAAWTPTRGSMKGLMSEGHRFLSLSEREVRRTAEQADAELPPHISVAMEPSATVVLAGLPYIREGSKTVLINTGKGIL